MSFLRFNRDGVFFNMNRKSIILIILILLLIAGGVFWWRQGQLKDQIPGGITLIKGDKDKIIKNEKEGYEIKIPKELIIRGTETQFISLFKKEAIPEKCILCPSEIDISTTEAPPNLSIEEWLEKEHKEAGFLYWDQREKITLPDKMTGYKIKEEGDPDHYNYYFAKENKIYIITALTESSFNEIIKNFVFLKSEK